MVKNKTDPETVCKSEGNHKHREEQTPYNVPQAWGACTGKKEPHNIWL